MQLTQQQLAAAENGQTVRIEANGGKFVLVREDLYRRCQSVLEADVPPETVAALIQQTMLEEDQGDPLLESYQSTRRTP